MLLDFFFFFLRGWRHRVTTGFMGQIPGLWRQVKSKPVLGMGIQNPSWEKLEHRVFCIFIAMAKEKFCSLAH